jgi:toxin YoeB
LATRQRQRAAAFDPSFVDDLRWWIDADPRVAERIVDLIEASVRDPFGGIGKPLELRGSLAGHWCRRITLSQRVVYLVRTDEVVFQQARFHY